MMDKILKTVEALRKNNMDAHYCKDMDELYGKIDEYMDDSKTCSWGGSVTLTETGVLNHLKDKGYKCLDRDDPNNDRAEMQHAALSCDVFFMSSNAVTLDGKLFNIDGHGNRVAALVYGPNKVIVVAGSNKIVEDVPAAVKRLQNIAAPLNAKRLKRKTPCTKTGTCMNCSSPERICCHTLLTEFQVVKDRIVVLMLDGEYGL